jgi:hypothetical protein
LELATSWGEGRLIAYDQLLLAAVYDASGDLDKAHTAAQKAHNLSSRLGITQGMIQELDGAEELLRRLLGKRL